MTPRESPDSIGAEHALVDPTTNSTRQQLEKAARDMDAQISFFEAQDRTQIALALDAIAGARVDAVNVLASPILSNGHDAIINRLRQARLSAIYQFPEAAGGRVTRIWATPTSRLSARCEPC